MKSIFPSLSEQMKAGRITGRQIADILHIDYRTVVNKMNGRTAITFDEAVAIRNYVQPGGDLETLFQRAGKDEK